MSKCYLPCRTEQRYRRVQCRVCRSKAAFSCPCRGLSVCFCLAHNPQCRRRLNRQHSTVLLEVCPRLRRSDLCLYPGTVYSFCFFDFLVLSSSEFVSVCWWLCRLLLGSLWVRMKGRRSLNGSMLWEYPFRHHHLQQKQVLVHLPVGK